MLRNEVASNKHDYDKENKLCSEFLNNFEDPSLPTDALHGKKKYKIALVGTIQTAKSRGRTRESGRGVA